MTRRTEYTTAMLEKVEQYIAGGYRECGDVIPSVAGLAIELGLSRSGVYKWIEDESKPEFAELIDRLKHVQERELVNNGLSGTFHPQITKVILARHGYSEKQEIDHTSSDGSMAQKHNVTIELVKPNGADQATDS